MEGEQFPLTPREQEFLRNYHKEKYGEYGIPVNGRGGVLVEEKDLIDYMEGICADL